MTKDYLEPGLAEVPKHELLEFLTELGRALIGTDDSVGEVRDILSRIAVAYGLNDKTVLVLPTIISVRVPDVDGAVIDLAAGLNTSLRLDQTEAIFNLVEQAELAAIAPDEGLARLRQILAKPPRFHRLTYIPGYVIFVIGIGLNLSFRPKDLLACAIFGLIVGVLQSIISFRRSLDVFLPVVSAFLVSLGVFIGVRHSLTTNSLLLLIPPLVNFLPGIALTLGMQELTEGDMISGSSRLVAGAIQLILLVFGIVIAAQVIGVPTQSVLVRQPIEQLGPWAPWLGVLVYSLGYYLMQSVSPKLFPWMLLMLYVAAIGQHIGNFLFGAYFGGFLGAFSVVVVAHITYKRFGAPASHVIFLPAFGLLVPGSLGVIGLSELAGANIVAALADLDQMVFSLVAISLGVLLGIEYERLFPSAAHKKEKP